LWKENLLSNELFIKKARGKNKETFQSTKNFEEMNFCFLAKGISVTFKQVSITSTFYASVFRTKVLFLPKSFCHSQNVTREKLLNLLLYEKCVHKILMKLTTELRNLSLVRQISSKFFFSFLGL